MDNPRQVGAQHNRSRGRRLALIAALIIVAIMFVGPIGSILVNWMWFESVGFLSAYSIRLYFQVLLFVAAGLAFFLVFAANAVIAARMRARRDVLVEIMHPQGGGETSALSGIVLAVGLFLAIIIGLGYSGSWQTVLRFLHPASFGTADPLFGLDVGFFVFTLPMYELLHGWAMATLILTLLGVLAIYVIRFVLPQLSPQESLEGQIGNVSFDFGRGVKTHLSILGALLVLAFAIRNWLDMFKLNYSDNGLVFGAGYTDVHARWPALWATLVAAVLLAVLILVGMRRRGHALTVLGLTLWLGIWIIGGSIYPGIIQRFQVQPSELDKERPYLESNIKLTNQAYNLDRVVEVDFPAEEAVTAEEIAANTATIKNIRILDPTPLLDTFNQIQSIRQYYDFRDVDVDRYAISGETRQVMLSARELSPGKLSAQAQTWVNQRLQFTHGYGLVMSPVNSVTPEGLPELLLRDVPPQGALSIQRPEIYYGENTNDYVIVKTTTPEFDYPKGDQNVYVKYEGNSGVPIGSSLNRLLFAWQFGDMNILLAGSVTSESAILFHRNIKERAQMAVPFLRFDADPYAVVAGGRLYWMLDAYTESDRYPYSEPVRLSARTTVNYLRNSVKAVVDAYDGSIRYYISDPSDPLIQSYAAIFPSLFTALDQMPAELRAHVRYPEDMFRIQAELYRTYHMRDPRVFYNREDTWNIAREIRAGKTTAMEPYYVIMKLPGEQQAEFTLILPFTPPDKDNMITWLAARSDGDAYGTLLAYRYPKDKLIYGPIQIEARMDQDPTISPQLTLWNQSGSRVIRGNLIVIPIGKSNLYVVPIYLQSEQTRLPEMKRVVMATGSKVVMEPTVDDGLKKLFGSQPSAVPPAPAPSPSAPAPTPVPQRQFSEAARAMLDRLSKLQDEIKQLRDDLQQLLQSSGPTQ